MANLINTMFISYKVSKNDFQEFAINFYILNAYEKMFSLFQTVKILDYVNLTYNDITSNKFKSIKNYKEKTNVFAYYILKSLWLFFDDDFLNIFMKNNKFKKDNFDKIVNNMLLLIKDRYKNAEFLRIFKIIENKFKKVKKNKDKYIKLNNSLRMTLFNVC